LARTGCRRELVVGAFDAGESEQILGEPIHAAGVLQNDAKEFEGGFRAGIGILDERLDVALDGSERRAQLVTDVGDEFAAGFLRGLDAGDVVEHDERATGGQWRGVDFKDAAGRKQAGAAHAKLAALERATHAGQQLRIAHRVDQRAAGRELRSDDACMTALDQRTKPAEVMATTASCMESSITANSARPLSSSAKSLPSRAAVSLRAASTAESSAIPVVGPAVGQWRRCGREIAAGDAVGEADNAAQTNGDPLATKAARGRANTSAIRADHKASRPSISSVPSFECSSEALNDELDHQRLKRQEEDKKPKQPGEEVGGHKNSSQLSAISLQSCRFRIHSRYRAICSLMVEHFAPVSSEEAEG
jgi:hypothetical protein